MQQKLAVATELIRESCNEKEIILQANNELKLENDRLKLKVEQKKTQYALLEERKAENELKMKSEIKFLLYQQCMMQSNSGEDDVALNMYSQRSTSDRS